MQTKLGSLVEKIVETGIAFVISFLASPYIFSAHGLESSMSQNFGVVFWFTIIAIIRGYFVRRIANYIIVRRNKNAQ